MDRFQYSYHHLLGDSKLTYLVGWWIWVDKTWLQTICLCLITAHTHTPKHPHTHTRTHMHTRAPRCRVQASFWGAEKQRLWLLREYDCGRSASWTSLPHGTISISEGHKDPKTGRGQFGLHRLMVDDGSLMLSAAKLCQIWIRRL